MSGQHEKRKKLGIVLVALKESLNGFDTGAGLVKIPLWLMGLTITAVYAPSIFAVALPLGVLSAIRAIIDENDNHAKIDEQEKQLAKLEMDAYEVEENLEVFFKKDFLENQTRYPELYAFGVNNVNKKALLKYLLRDYFKSLGNAKRKQNEHFHSQGKILALIKRVTGYDSKDPDFLANMKKFLSDDDLHNALTAFYHQIPLEKYEANSEVNTNSNQNFFVKTKNFFYKQKKLREVARRAIDFISDLGMGMGVAASLMSLFGVVVAGAPVTLPLLAVMVGAGLVFAGITLAYNLYVDKERKQVIKKLDNKIKDKELSIDLAKRILKLQKQTELQKQNELFPGDNKFILNNEIEPGSKHNIVPKIDVKLPLAFKFRIAGATVTQSIASIALGMAVGMGLVWVATLIAPVIPFLLPALIVGGLFTAYYLTRTLKTQYKSTVSEIDKYKEIVSLEDELKRSIGENNFNNILSNDNKKKDNRSLLKEVINDYVNYLKALNQEAIKIKHNPRINESFTVFKKQNKMLALIEQVSGVKRGDDLDLFYNKVAHYLKGDEKDSANANKIVQNLKNKIHLPQGKVFAVNADDPRANVKTSFLKQLALKFGKDHFLPVLGVVGLALVVPIFLIGPQAFVAIGVLGAIVIGAHFCSKIAQYKSEKQAAQLTEKSNQLALIKRKIKIQHKLDGIQPKPELIVHENAKPPVLVVHKKFGVQRRTSLPPNFLDWSKPTAVNTRKTVDLSIIADSANVHQKTTFKKQDFDNVEAPIEYHEPPLLTSKQ